MKKNLRIKNKLAAGVVLAGLAVATSLRAGAAPIALKNNSFDTNLNNTPQYWAGGNVQATGQYLSTSVGAGASGPDYLALLPQYGAANAHTSSVQTTTKDITALDTGETITLKVALGEYDYNGSTFGVTPSDFYGTVELKIGGQLAVTNDSSDTPALTAGGFSELTLTYTVQSTDSGDVGVEFITPAYDTSLSNGKVDRYFDNVSLDISGPSVPEPSTWAMMLAGLLSLVGLQRFTRRHN